MARGSAPGLVAQPGLRWEENERGIVEPTWTHDPKEEVIIELVRHHLKFRDEDSCTADYYMQGPFNKIYLIRCPRDSPDEQSYIFRVSLPVDPGFKVSSDVATMMFVADNTTIPVPQVLAFDASHNNKLGFAWTIMNFIKGKSLAEQWRYLNWDQRVKLVQRMADVNLSLFQKVFWKIGNLYKKTYESDSTSLLSPTTHNGNGGEVLQRNGMPESPESTQGLEESDTDVSVTDLCDLDDYHLGRIVSMPFIWHKRVHYHQSRGPFYSSQDWLLARLDLVVMDCDEVVEDRSTDTQQIHAAIAHRVLACRLKYQFSLYYKGPRPPGDTDHSKSRQTTLHHYDTSGFNVMVDEEGNLCGLLDWDCVSVVPFWKACQLPEFLTSTFIDEFADHEAPSETKIQAIAEEKAKLVKIFLDRIRLRDWMWIDVYESCPRIRDFDLAITLCDTRSKADVVEEWVKNLEDEGEYWSLEKRLAAE